MPLASGNRELERVVVGVGDVTPSVCRTRVLRHPGQHVSDGRTRVGCSSRDITWVRNGKRKTRRRLRCIDVCLSRRLGKVSSKNQILGVKLPGLQSPHIACASEKMALAANVVECYRDAVDHLSLHAEIPEEELRCAASQVRVRKSNTSTIASRAALSPVAGGKGLA